MTTSLVHRPRIEPAIPHVLTSDELRAIARLSGATLPPTLMGYEPNEDDQAADAAAVRALIARGVVAFNRDGEQPIAELTPPAREALDPLLRANELVEIDRELPAGADRHVLASVEGARLRFSEAEPDIWVLTPDGDLNDVLATIAGELDDSDEPRGPHPPPFSVTVSAFTHEHAELLVGAGQADDAAAVLEDDGVSADDARVLADALGHRCTETAVRRASRDVDGEFVAAENCWFHSGDHGWWLVHPADPYDSIELDEDDDVDAEPDEPEPYSTFHRTTRAAIRAALASTIGDTVTREGRSNGVR